jgi:thioredoxin 1
MPLWLGRTGDEINQMRKPLSESTLSQADAIKTLDARTFENLVLDGSGPIAVEFMSYSCAYCGAMEPVLQKVAQGLVSKEKFFRVNVAVEEQLASDYEIEGTPTLVMFLDGREVGRVEGADPDVKSVFAAVTEPFGA